MVTNNRVSGSGNLEVENYRFATSKIDMFYRCLKIRNGKSPFGMAAIQHMYEGCNHPNHHHQVGHFTAVDMLVKSFLYTEYTCAGMYHVCTDS